MALHNRLLQQAIEEKQKLFDEETENFHACCDLELQSCLESWKNGKFTSKKDPQPLIDCFNHFRDTLEVSTEDEIVSVIFEFFLVKKWKQQIDYLKSLQDELKLFGKEEISPVVESEQRKKYKVVRKSPTPASQSTTSKLEETKSPAQNGRSAPSISQSTTFKFDSSQFPSTSTQFKFGALPATPYVFGESSSPTAKEATKPTATNEEAPLTAVKVSLSKFDELSDDILSILLSYLSVSSLIKLDQSLASARLKGNWIAIKHRLLHKSNIGLCKKTLISHEDVVTSLIQLPNSKFVTGSLDGKMIFWNISGIYETTWTPFFDDGISSMIRLLDGRIAVGSSDGTIKLLNANSMFDQKVLGRHEKYVVTLMQMSDGKMISSSWDDRCKIWNISYETCERTSVDYSGYYMTCFLQLSNGGLVSGRLDGQIMLLSNGNSRILFGHDASITALIQLPDSRMVSSSADKTIRIWNVNSGLCERTIDGHSDGVTCLIQLSDGRLLSGSRDKTIKMWDISSGLCVKTFVGHNEAVTCVIQLSNGWIVSGSKDYRVKLWSIK